MRHIRAGIRNADKAPMAGGVLLPKGAAVRPYEGYAFALTSHYGATKPSDLDLV
jgi:hypothetical protein